MVTERDEFVQAMMRTLQEKGELLVKAAMESFETHKRYQELFDQFNILRDLLRRTEKERDELREQVATLRLVAEAKLS